MKIVRANRSDKGFTLIELMIVVAVVAILAAIAIPSYQRQVIRTNRANAMAVLQSFAQAMERHYAQNNTYATAVVGTVFPNQSPLDGAARYALSIEPAPATTATTFTLRATPTAGQSQVGDGFIEITNTGLRSWDRDNSGAIGAGENTWDKP
jgi:type IV pilus assembly protein PilE